MAGLEKSLTAHHVENVCAIAINPIEDAARRLNNLPVTPPLQLGRPRTALRMIGQLLYMLKHALDQLPRGLGLVQCDVVGDGIQV